MINWKNGRLESGKLRHRIDLVKVSPVQDSTGSINFSSGLVYSNVWASVEALSGEEALGGQAEMSTVSWQVVIRYIAGAPSWQPCTFYKAGSLVKDLGGYLQQATVDLTSSAVAPTWNETEGMFTEDGNPSLDGLWLNLGIAPPYTGVTAAMQVWWQGRQFQIKSVLNPDGRNKLLALMCVEIDDSRMQLQNNQPKGLN